MQWHLVYSQCCVTITSIWFWDIFSTPKRKPCTPWVATPHSPPRPQFLKTTSLLSVSTDLPLLYISSKWKHTIYDLLCLASFTYYNFEVYLHCSKYQHFALFHGCILFHHRDRHICLSSSSVEVPPSILHSRHTACLIPALGSDSGKHWEEVRQETDKTNRGCINKEVTTVGSLSLGLPWDAVRSASQRGQMQSLRYLIPNFYSH